MSVPISVRLDEDVRDELEIEARARGVGLATLLRDLAKEAAREARRTRIRHASAAIGALVETSAEGRTFYEQWGTRQREPKWRGFILPARPRMAPSVPRSPFLPRVQSSAGD
jgi:hypothetical protein